jgi:hypothetical protein
VAYDGPYTPASFIQIAVTGNAIAAYTGQHSLFLPPSAASSVTFPISIEQGGTDANTAIQAKLNLNIPGLVSTDYIFTPQAPGGSLVAYGSNQPVTLSPCPIGVNGTDTGHFVHISGGTGTAEDTLITGGTCTSGANSGTITITPSNNHSGAWTVGSSSSGIQEALIAATATTANRVTVPEGSQSVSGTISIPESVDIECLAGSTINWTGGAADVIDIATQQHHISDCAITSQNVSLTSGYAINIIGPVNGHVILDRPRISNTHSGIGITNNAFLVRINDPDITDYGQASPTTAYAIEILGNSSDIRVSNAFVYGGAGGCASLATAPNGFHLKNAQGVYMVGINELGCLSNQVVIDPTGKIGTATASGTTISCATVCPFPLNLQGATLVFNGASFTIATEANDGSSMTVSGGTPTAGTHAYNASESVMNNWFHNLVTDTSGATGGSSLVTIQPSGTGVALRNFFRGGWDATSNRFGFLFDSQNCTADCIYANSIDDNYIGNNARDGILFIGDLMTANEVTNNYLYGNSTSSPGTYSGIHLAIGTGSTGPGSTHIVGNHIGFPAGDTQGYGIYDGSFNTSTLIASNYIAGNTVGPLYEAFAPSAVGTPIMSSNVGMDSITALRNQTASIGGPTSYLYQNVPPGMFQVSAFIITVGESSSTCTAAVTIASNWYTGIITTTLVAAHDLHTFSQDGGASIVGVGTSSTNITYAVTLTGGGGCSSAQYDVVFVLEMK